MAEYLGPSGSAVIVDGRKVTVAYVPGGGSTWGPEHKAFRRRINGWSEGVKWSGVSRLGLARDWKAVGLYAKALGIDVSEARRLVEGHTAALARPAVVEAKPRRFTVAYKPGGADRPRAWSKYDLARKRQIDAEAVKRLKGPAVPKDRAKQQRDEWPGAWDVTIRRAMAAGEI